MVKAIIGRKLKMTQIFEKDGKPVPVTVVEAGHCFVTQVKTKEKDGYEAIQLGYGEAKKIKKPQEGILKKAKIEQNLKYFKEFQAKDIANIQVGNKIEVSLFSEGDKVNISGISKGKGYQGVIKRHGFRRGPETHGSDHHRHPGSIGSMFPQRVIKGRKMPGHMGVEKVTLRGIAVMKVIPETNIIILKGAIPGPRKSIVNIQG